MKIARRQTRQIGLGRVKIGKGAPVSIQSMTKTDTKDIEKTVRQIKRLEGLGCEIIRVAVKDEESASVISKLKKGISIPLEADIHFDYRLALSAIEQGSDGIRLNPGNIHMPAQVKEIIKAAKDNGIPVRIGVNSGSLSAISYQPIPHSPHPTAHSPHPRPHTLNKQADAMVNSVMDYLKIFEKENFHDIMISLKASDVVTTIEAYRKMAKLCDYPFHLGVTATGVGNEGIIKSAIGIGTLLTEGIGDTIRVSLTSAPEDEVIAAKEILQALGLRRFSPEIISCPTCGRCQVDLIRIVEDIKSKLSAKEKLTAQTPHPRPHTPDSTACYPTVAIMGCEVNGPGEAKEADIGIAFGKDSGVLFEKGKVIKKVKAKDAVAELLRNIND